MKKFKQNAAITLIALVITIIILLILAGVALSTLVNNGLFEKAKLAKEVSAYTSAKEIVSMKLMEIAMNKKGTCTIEDIAKSMKNADNITIEKYYNEDVALIKTGITENLINLKSIVVSVNEYSKYKFLIGQSTLIEGVLNEEITDTTPADKFKDTDKFEDDLFGKH